MENWLIVAVRVLSAALWFAVAHKLIRGERFNRAGRSMVMSVVCLGMTVLVVGSLVPMGIVPGDLAHLLYTAFTAYAAFVAIGILIER